MTEHVVQSRGPSFREDTPEKKNLIYIQGVDQTGQISRAFSPARLGLNSLSPAFQNLLLSSDLRHESFPET